jgi:hypothetical protein
LSSSELNSESCTPPRRFSVSTSEPNGALVEKSAAIGVLSSVDESSGALPILSSNGFKAAIGNAIGMMASVGMRGSPWLAVDVRQRLRGSP